MVLEQSVLYKVKYGHAMLFVKYTCQYTVCYRKQQQQQQKIALINLLLVDQHYSTQLLLVLNALLHVLIVLWFSSLS